MVVWTIATIFRDRTLSIMPRKVENVVFAVAIPKSCWLLVIWNSYKKVDLEDATQNQKITCEIRIFVFAQGLVGYSGRVNWCLSASNATMYTTGKNDLSNEYPCRCRVSAYPYEMQALQSHCKPSRLRTRTCISEQEQTTLETKT